MNQELSWVLPPQSNDSTYEKANPGLWETVDGLGMNSVNYERTVDGLEEN